MRKINTRKFQRVIHSTQREINRKIVLNLVREHQPISRAELARLTNLSCGPRLHGATALLVARKFAAPRVA